MDQTLLVVLCLAAVCVVAVAAVALATSTVRAAQEVHAKAMREGIDKLFAERHAHWSSSPEGRMADTMARSMEMQAAKIDELTDKVMAYTQEGRDLVAMKDAVRAANDRAIVFQQQHENLTRLLELKAAGEAPVPERVGRGVRAHENGTVQASFGGGHDPTV